MNDQKQVRVIAATIIFTTAALALMLAGGWSGFMSSAGVKMAASTGFLATALAAGALRGSYGRTILAALVFCWWGDYFLTRGSDTSFLLGLVAFLLGHLGFAVAFMIHGANTRWTFAAAVLLLIPATAVYLWLEEHLGPMKLPVCAYIAVISLMLALATGTRGRGATPLILIGAALFYASDLFVARQKFATPSPWNPLIGLPLYYAAQLCLAVSVASRK
ncbi:MAG: lysoplasmalogenase [Candidatus Hydrogenedentes bacterium]|nr:lysoplasmalogenase [Candidatus Hydrogenedentota bacterium]